ncbi:MAG TPA: peptidylprolyl isomerase [Gemmatimonadales bacterium]|nr:peptidylprolyl isomerase [Gemmatimonadales bacterium]
MRVPFGSPSSPALALGLCLVFATPAFAQADSAVRADSAAAPVASPVTPDTLLVNRVVAVVGNEPILLSDVQRELGNQVAQRRIEAPEDSATYERVMRETALQLIEAQLLVQKARMLDIEVSEEEVTRAVDQQVQRVRQNFSSDAEYARALQSEGFGTPEEYRSTIADDFRRNQLQMRLLPVLQEEGKLPTATVSAEDVNQAYAENRDRLPPKPASVSFRQIVIAPQPTPEARQAARTRADSILAELRKGADFAEAARNFSADPGSAVNGGDLGWNRRGVMVPAFDFWMFELPPGQLSPIVETSFGYHIIRVDRVQPAERKVRHILITAEVDSADVERARVEAQGVAEALRSGVSFDSLVAIHHDDPEEKLVNELQIEQLPPPYATALGNSMAGAVVDPFVVPDPRGAFGKFVVMQILERELGGQMTEAEAKRVIRDQLQQERTIRRYLDQLRKEIHVSEMLDVLGA